MPKCFVIEDEFHSEHIGEYPSLDEAWQELKRWASIAWDQPPNVAPCTSWKTCGRNYEIIEYDISGNPWEEIRRIAGLTIDSKGLIWGPDAPFADSVSSE